MSDDLSDDQGTNPDDDLPHPRESPSGMPGFVPPEQRSWVHPSELRAAAAGASGSAPAPVGANVFSVNPSPTTPRLQTRRRTIGAMAIGMAIACGVVGALAFVDSPTTPGGDGAAVENASLVRGEVTTLTTTVPVTAWIGLEGHSVTRWSGSALEVTAVTAGGPADIAQIAPGDAVISINGRPVTSMAALRATLSGLRAETTVELVMWRAGRQREVNVILGSAPAA